MPHFETIVDTQAGRERGRHQVATARRPFAVGRVRRRELVQLLQRLAVPEVNGAVQVAETGNGDHAALRVEADKVARLDAKVVDRVRAVVKKTGLRWHRAIDDDKLFRVRAPCHVVHLALLVCVAL